MPTDTYTSTQEDIKIKFLKEVGNMKESILNNVFKPKLETLFYYNDSSYSFYADIEYIQSTVVDDNGIFKQIGELLVQLVHLSRGSVENDYSVADIYITDKFNMDNEYMELRFIHRFGTKKMCLFFETVTLTEFDPKYTPIKCFEDPFNHFLFPIPLKYTDSRSIQDIPNEILNFYKMMKKYLVRRKFSNFGFFEFEVLPEVDIYLKL